MLLSFQMLIQGDSQAGDQGGQNGIESLSLLPVVTDSSKQCFPLVHLPSFSCGAGH